MDQDQTTDLCVENLDEQVDDKHLHNEFTSFGTITSIKIMRIGHTKGYVRFSSTKSAYKAVLELNGKLIGLKQVHVFLIPRKVFDEALMFAGSSTSESSMLLHQFSLNNLDCPENISQSGNISLVDPSMPIIQQQVSHIQGGPITPHEEQQREILAANLFSLIYNASSRVAVEVTGVLLQTDNFGLLHLINNTEYREWKMKETYAKLRRDARSKFIVEEKDLVSYVNREIIFAVVKEVDSTLASEITDILMECDLSVRQHILQSKEYLEEKVRDATAVVKANKAKAAAQAQIPKQEIGAMIYPFVQALYPSYAGKLTGMLLGLTNPELFSLLENTDNLKVQVDQVFVVYQAHLHRQAKASVIKEHEDKQVLTESAGTAAMLQPHQVENFENQNKMLKKKLRSLVYQIHPGLADKILKILLALDNSELVNMVEHRYVLVEKVEQAVSMLNLEED